MQNLSGFEGTRTPQSRRALRVLLWRAFPSASEHELSHKAAPVLDYTPRQIRNWLREENEAPMSVFLAVLALAGGEIVFGRIQGR